MDKLEIIGNGHERELLNWEELTEKEKDDLMDYTGIQDSHFFRYKNNIYDINDFMIIDKNEPKEFQRFDGHMSDSFFSGILIKLCDDIEYIKVYTFIS